MGQQAHIKVFNQNIHFTETIINILILGIRQKARHFYILDDFQRIGRFFHRVAMSVYICIYMSPPHAIFFVSHRGKNTLKNVPSLQMAVSHLASVP